MSATCIVPKETLGKHGIRKLPYFPAFDRVLVYQLADAVSDKAGEGSLIYKPESLKARQEREECRGLLLAAGAAALDPLRAPGTEGGARQWREGCRGLLLAAGAAAMDHLRSHGIEVGDVVWFSRLAIWRHVAD